MTGGVLVKIGGTACCGGNGEDGPEVSALHAPMPASTAADAGDLLGGGGVDPGKALALYVLDAA